MNQASTAMLDDHEYRQRSKGYGDSEEKVTGNDLLGVQAKKGASASFNHAWGCIGIRDRRNSRRLE
jgi:hypothetical protein